MKKNYQDHRDGVEVGGLIQRRAEELVKEGGLLEGLQLFGVHGFEPVGYILGPTYIIILCILYYILLLYLIS